MRLSRLIRSLYSSGVRSLVRCWQQQFGADPAAISGGVGRVVGSADGETAGTVDGETADEVPGFGEAPDADEAVVAVGGEAAVSAVSISDLVRFSMIFPFLLPPALRRLCSTCRGTYMPHRFSFVVPTYPIGVSARHNYYIPTWGIRQTSDSLQSAAIISVGYCESSHSVA